MISRSTDGQEQIRVTGAAAVAMLGDGTGRVGVGFVTATAFDVLVKADCFNTAAADVNAERHPFCRQQESGQQNRTQDRAEQRH